MRQAGLTLIEMMIVVLLIAILALLATPLTSGWIDSARLGEAQGALEQAVGHAKAAALRNPAGLKTGQAASAICLSGTGVLSVHNATPVVAPNVAVPVKCGAGAPTAAWSTQLPPNITIKNNDQAWTCSCFTNTALLTKTDDCAACGTSMTFKITSGSESPHEVNIY